jgi:hypothetical protein
MSSSPTVAVSGARARTDSRRPGGRLVQAQAHRRHARPAVLQLARGAASAARRPPTSTAKRSAEALDVAEVVRSEEHRLAFAAPAADEAVERAQAVRVEGGRGLVEEQNRRVGEHGHREAPGAAPCRPEYCPTGRAPDPLRAAKRRTSSTRLAPTPRTRGRTPAPRARTATPGTRRAEAGRTGSRAPPGSAAGTATEPDLARRGEGEPGRGLEGGRLPEPLGPRSATTSPAPISRFRDRTASSVP